MTRAWRNTHSRPAAAAAFLFALAAVLCGPATASAQWTTSGNNTTTGNNVGVGTSAPAQIFHVHSGGTWAGTRVTTAGTGSTIGDGVNFGFDDSYGAYVWNREASALIFATGNAEKARFAPNGNFGIGLTSPGYKLDVSGSVNGSSLCIAGDCRSSWPQATGNSSGWADDGASVRLAASTDSVVIGTTAAPAAKLHVVGNVLADGDLNVSGTVTGGNVVAKYQDVAEWVPSTQKLMAGTVVVLDSERANHVMASTRAYDTAVAGVVSEMPGVLLGVGGEGKLMIATTGRVRVKVDATRGAVRVGDLLVTGERGGVAMKSVPLRVGGAAIHRPGTIIGKALEPLAGGVGEILVLLSLQ